ncbi:MAG: hypothetical protein NTV30_08715 [Chloroflexi bacterium]|nr:hypothetical protein [Chloroflexota bacterium]
MNHKKLWSLVSIALMLTVFIGCGRMELLQNDNIESYKFLDHQALAPGMSLQEALDTIQNPPANNPAKLSEAISTVMEVMGLETSVTDPYKKYSINDMTQAKENALKDTGFSLSKGTLESIMINVINEAIKQVNSGTLDRTKPENAGLFALAEGVMQRTGKTTLTIEDAANPNLIDIAGFLVLATAMNQAINSVADDAIIAGSKEAIQETVDEVNSVIPGAPIISGDVLFNQLVPKPNPALGGLLTSVVKEQLLKEPEVKQKEEDLMAKTKSDILAVVDEKIKNQFAAELTSTLKQMQVEGKLQGVSIPGLIDFNNLNDVLNQVSGDDLKVIRQQVISIQGKIVEKVKGDVATEFKDIKQSEIETFVEKVAGEMGIKVALVLRPHNQGIIIIR